ncbi:MAG: SAM-dependent methyltransferase, partial [Verrucomicrobiota bacterium]
QITHRRPNGTLRAYFQNQLLPPPEAYQNPGFQDLTADVNFEDLQNLAHKNHLKNEFLTSQREFLLPHLRQTSSDQFLSDPQGAGGSFQVLLQSKT